MSSRTLLDIRPDGSCLTCDEGYETSGDEYCPMSKRSCDHHCNCLWTADKCHWCGGEPDGSGATVIPFDRLPRCRAVYQPDHVRNLYAIDCTYHVNHEGDHSWGVSDV